MVRSEHLNIWAKEAQNKKIKTPVKKPDGGFYYAQNQAHLHGEH